MKKLFVAMAIVLGVLFTGCDDSWTSIVDKEVTLTSRMFNIQEYEAAQDIYQTSDTECVFLTSGTSIGNGTIMDVHTGCRIRYSSTSFVWLHDENGFAVFVRYADELTILE